MTTSRSKIAVIDCLDEVAIPERIRDEVYKLYPEAKIMQMKSGGNFPYLSRAEEFNLYLQVHLRNHTPEINLEKSETLKSKEEDSNVENINNNDTTMEKK